MAWEVRHFNFGVGEEVAYLIKHPKKNKSLYSLFVDLFKKSPKEKTLSPKEKGVKG